VNGRPFGYGLIGAIHRGTRRIYHQRESTLQIAVRWDGWGTSMQDMTKHLEKLRKDAAECELISNLATDKDKRDLFAKLAQHHRTLAAEVERAIAEKQAGGS
jgi:hypothetical protein